MLQAQAEHIMGSAGAYLDGHFVLNSGKHARKYVNKDKVYPDVEAVSGLCNGLAELYMNDEVEAVSAPALGGLILCTWTTHFLRRLTQRMVWSTFAEKTGELSTDPFVVRRGYDQLIRGKRTLIVEDIVTTGGSVARVATAVRECGGIVVGVAALVNRGNVTAEMIGVPLLRSLVNTQIQAWEEAECEQNGPCHDKVPISTNVGHGTKWLEKRAAEGRPYSLGA